MVGELPRGAGGVVTGRLDTRHRMAAKPVFTRASGDAFTTRDVHDTARRMAAALRLQLDVARFPARSPFGQGGRRTFRVVLGMSGQEYIKARGRWHSITTSRSFTSARWRATSSTAPRAWATREATTWSR